MDAIPEAFGYVVDLCLHIKNHHRHSKPSKGQKLTTGFIGRTLVVVAVFGALIAYGTYVVRRCVKSYDHPIYQSKVLSEPAIVFPEVYICTSDRTAVFQDSQCVIDFDWSFDIHNAKKHDGIECSVESVQVPNPNKRFGSLTCAVFNKQRRLNASQVNNSVTTMHIVFGGFSGVNTKPLVASLVDKDLAHERLSHVDPSFIFSAFTDVYGLMRKYVTEGQGGDVNDVEFVTTISSSMRDVSAVVTDKTYVGLQFATFDVTHYEETVEFSYLDALAAIGGAACLARIVFVCVLPHRRRSSSDDIHHREDKDENDISAVLETKESHSQPLLDSQEDGGVVL